jgi:hypothetical protein
MEIEGVNKDTVLAIIVDANDVDGEIDRVSFIINNTVVFVDYTKPYQYNWNIVCSSYSGKQDIKVIAYDNDGEAGIDGFKLQIEDYRFKFFGSFYFVSKKATWILDKPWAYETIYYHGMVRPYKLIDSDNDLCSYGNDNNVNPNNKITIEFIPGNKITSGIYPDGHLYYKWGYHYDSWGSFNSIDTIKFSISGLGGLGGGVNYEIIGVRE